MEEEILDDIEPIAGIKFAKRSFYCFLFPMITIPVLIFSQLEIFIWALFPIGLISILFVIPVGLYSAYKSIQLKEQSIWYKYIGLIGNLLILALALAIIVANLIDIQNAFAK